MKKYLGLDAETNPEWLICNEGVCEGCGFDYLNNNKDRQENVNIK